MNILSVADFHQEQTAESGVTHNATMSQSPEAVEELVIIVGYISNNLLREAFQSKKQRNLGISPNRGGS